MATLCLERITRLTEGVERPAAELDAASGTDPGAAPPVHGARDRPGDPLGRRRLRAGHIYLRERVRLRRPARARASTAIHGGARPGPAPWAGRGGPTYRWLANTPPAHVINQRTEEALRDLRREIGDEAPMHAAHPDLMGQNVF